MFFPSSLFLMRFPFSDFVFCVHPSMNVAMFLSIMICHVYFLKKCEMFLKKDSAHEVFFSRNCYTCVMLCCSVALSQEHKKGNCILIHLKECNRKKVAKEKYWKETIWKHEFWKKTSWKKLFIVQDKKLEKYNSGK